MVHLALLVFFVMQYRGSNREKVIVGGVKMSLHKTTIQKKEKKIEVNMKTE